MNWIVQVSQWVWNNVGESSFFQVTNLVCCSKFLPLTKKQKCNVALTNVILRRYEDHKFQCKLVPQKKMLVERRKRRQSDRNTYVALGAGGVIWKCIWRGQKKVASVIFHEFFTYFFETGCLIKPEIYRFVEVGWPYTPGTYLSLPQLRVTGIHDHAQHWRVLGIQFTSPWFQQTYLPPEPSP